MVDRFAYTEQIAGVNPNSIMSYRSPSDPIQWEFAQLAEGQDSPDDGRSWIIVDM